MWNNKKVSLIFPTYKEKNSIRNAIKDFESCGFLDEIIVVNNNAEVGTSEEVLAANSKITKEVLEKKQGYGFAIRRGFEEATGELIIVSEPDSTFFGRDVVKLLAYSDAFDVVYGSRTAKELIWKGANMGWFLRWGNFFMAKLVEVLFNTTSLTDVGCTMRLVKKEVIEKISPHFTVGREHFGPEMMILTFLHKFKVLQIPVNYTERVGESAVTGNQWKAFRLGLIMLVLILKYRL
ncbi:glycosyltransferase family 2 protein, partial [Patescibacteria group bacterium]|nr:glycosyltransferase family 2 protein [Patescibacteria group bacterium]